MAVHIRMKQSGAPPATSFTDSLTGTATTTFGWGDNWQFIQPGPTTVDCSTLSTYVITSGVGGSFSSAAVNQNNGTHELFAPLSIINTVRLSQYVEAKYVSNNSAQGTAVLVCGVMALCGTTSSTYRSYGLSWVATDANPANHSWNLTRFLNFASATLLVNGGAASCVANDVMGLSVEVQPTQNVLKVWKNNVLQTTFNDNNANRPVTGFCGVGRTAFVSNAAPGNRIINFTGFVGRAGTRDS
jgi:hypothetical protein